MNRRIRKRKNFIPITYQRKSRRSLFGFFCQSLLFFFLALQLSSCASRGGVRRDEGLQLDKRDVLDLTNEETEEDADLELFEENQGEDDQFDDGPSSDFSSEDSDSFDFGDEDASASEDEDFEEEFAETESQEDSTEEEEPPSDFASQEDLETEFDEELEDGLDDQGDQAVKEEGGHFDVAQEDSQENPLGETQEEFSSEKEEEFQDRGQVQNEEQSEVFNQDFASKEKEQGSNLSSGVFDDFPQKQKTLLSSQNLRDFLLSPHPPNYVGKKISIELRNADIRDAFELITLESGLNMILSDGVHGQVSLKLKDVPWDQALVMILRVKKLGYIRYDNVLQISPQSAIDEELMELKRRIREEREEEEREALSLDREEEELQLLPLKMQIVSVRYSDASSLENQITPLLTKGRGTVSAHKRTNSLIIKDTEEALINITKLIKVLDTPPLQVLIEGKFVEAQEDFQREFGIRWGHLTDIQRQSGQGEAGVQGSGASAINFASPLAGRDGQKVNIGGNFKISPVDEKKIVGPFSALFNIGTFKFLGDFGAQLALSEQDNKVKVISSPQIVVVNNESAIIQQTGENIFTTSIQVPGTEGIQQKVQRDPIKLELKVTPQITLDESVLLKIDITRQFVGAALSQGEKNVARPINTRSAQTKVLIKNGHSAFIGGIYQKDEENAKVGLPLLSNIPILGWFFKSATKKLNKNELWIFLTPKILFSKEENLDDLDDIEQLDLEESEDQFVIVD